MLVGARGHFPNTMRFLEIDIKYQVVGVAISGLLSRVESVSVRCRKDMQTFEMSNAGLGSFVTDRC